MGEPFCEAAAGETAAAATAAAATLVSLKTPLLNAAAPPAARQFLPA